MAFTWPATLPQSPLLNSYQENPKDTTIKSEVAVGPEKIRNVATGALIPVSMTLLVSQAQTVILDEFYFGTIGRVGNIDWVHHRTGESALYRFKAPPTYTPVGTMYHASLQMEILPASFSTGYSSGFA